MYYFACYLRTFEIWKKKFCLKSPLLQLWYGWYFQTCMILIGDKLFNSTWCRNKISKLLVELGRKIQGSPFAEVT